MRIAAPQLEIAAAQAYEDLHVPALFGQWAPLVVRAVQIGRGDRVLDVACGTGVLGREARKHVGDEGFVAGVDAVAGMLAVADGLAPSVEWREGLAESLPYENESFDAVVSQFGLMFVRNRDTALREMLRVLVPGGRLGVAVWDSLERFEAYPVEVDLLERIAGTPAAEALRAPFVLGDQTRLAALFRDAGVKSVDITTHQGTARFPSIRAMVEADLRGWLPVMGVVLSEDTIETILEEAETVLRQYVTVRGSVEFAATAHIVTGLKPQSRPAVRA